MGAVATAPSLLDELLGAYRTTSRDRVPVVTLRGERTLDDLIVGAWEALSANLTVVCPVCEGELMPVDGAALWSPIGRCSGCGTELS